ncbi:hypothetical protein AAF712_015862 [Marasmius tenuissimus]|uniref:Uncharacterized protein n=1 Tax=Marasmius tenuissimus TaxID=585030 RepID=A0ABR2ZAJ4_9AGAR
MQRISTITLDDMGKEPQQKSNLRTDEQTTRYIYTIKFLISRLKSLSSYREAALTFSLCQRAYLELAGRVEWLATYRQLVHNPPTTRPTEEARVVGALTGIPVWFTQPGFKKEHTRVDRWIQPDSSSSQALVQHVLDSHPQFTLEDASPPYPVIFEGAVTNPDRYAKMGEYIRRFCTTNVYMENASIVAATAPTLTQASSSGPSRSSKTLNRHNPIQSGPESPNTASQSNPNNDRDKFIDVESAIMPPALRVWAEASRRAGAGFNPNTPPPAGRNNGYALPDPNIIASTRNEKTQAAFITTWLKLRQVLMYRLQSPTFTPLKVKEWRSVLGLEIHGLKAGTEAAKAREEQQKMLQSCLKSGNMGGSVNLAHLDTAPVTWQGITLTPFSLPPSDVVKEVLWELFEINFRYELVVLDRFCFRTGTSIADREQEVLGLVPHFNSSMIPDDIGQARIGFASTELNIASGRRHALRGLHQVMAGWTGGPGQLPRPLEDEGNDFSDRLLGGKKYVWHEASKDWSDEQGELFATRLEACLLEGLTTAPPRARYLVKYKKSLIGKQFKVLQQLGVFALQDLVPSKLMDLWKAAGTLGAYIWFPEIHDMEQYLEDLTVAIGNFFDIWSQFDPSRILTKVKLHILTHLPEDIRRFGPAVLYSTEVFEGRDISRDLAGKERSKHMVSGGWWKDGENGSEYICAGPKVVQMASLPEVRRRIGWTETSKLKPDLLSGTVKLVSQKQRQSLTWEDIGLSEFQPNPLDPQILWHKCRYIVSQSGDRCERHAWVMCRATETSFLGRIALIATPVNSPPDKENTMVAVERFDVMPDLHGQLDMPVVVPANFKQVLSAAVNTISPSRARVRISPNQISSDTGSHERQERIETSRLKSCVVHNSTQRVLPRDLVKPRPHLADRRMAHDTISSALQVTEPQRRAEIAEKARKTREANAQRLLAGKGILADGSGS